MGLKVIILGEHAGTDQFFLQDGHKVEEVFGGVVADVVHLVRGWAVRPHRSASRGRAA